MYDDEPYPPAATEDLPAKASRVLAIGFVVAVSALTIVMLSVLLAFAGIEGGQ